MVKEIQKAIEITELQKDLDGLISQAQAVSGAIQYIRQKIALLSKKEEEKDVLQDKGST